MSFEHTQPFLQTVLVFCFHQTSPNGLNACKSLVRRKKQKCINTLMFHIVMSKKPFMIQLSKHQFQTHIKHDTQ